jgi:hypothetical protein
MIVFFNDGKGALQFSHIENIDYPFGGETADLDRDGDQEITHRGDRLILNDGTGHFIEKLFPGRPIGSVKAHDFNNDGIIDFAIGNYLSDTLYFGLSQKGGAFNKLQKIIAPLRPIVLYIHGLSYDLNNDGRIDFLYVGGSGKGGFTSLQSTASDSLEELQLFLEPPNGFDTFYGNDLDGDGDIDYAFGSGGLKQDIVFSNDGHGKLSPAGLQNAKLVSAVEGGDWDGDGDIDLAFAISNLVSTFPESYAPDVSIFLNDGKGNFSLASRVRLPFDRSLSHMLRAVDFDLDGDLDLVGVANGLLYLVANAGYATAVTQQKSSYLPQQLFIDPVYPNPTKTVAAIVLKLTDNRDNEKITISIFDVTGKNIRTWRLTRQERLLKLVWDLRDQKSQIVPSGVYFVQAQRGQLRTIQKISVVR